MKIAMMTNNYKPFVAGVPISVERLTCQLRKLGHEVYVFAPHYKNEVPEPYVVRFHSISLREPEGAVLPVPVDKAITKVFDKERFDIIHVHHPMMVGYLALHLGKKYQIPVFYTCHTQYEQYLHYWKLYGWLENRRLKERSKLLLRFENRILFYGGEVIVPGHNRWFANQCDRIFAPTESIKQDLLKNQVLTPVEVLPTGLDNQDFMYDEEKSREIREKYLENKKWLFCTVSRLEKEKNLSFLLRGLTQLKKTLGDEFRVLIIGEGSRQETLKREAIALGLEEQVCFLGSVPHSELHSYYNACDLFLFASRSETQGLVLLEAMAAELPVVAVEGNGVNDLVVNGENGYRTEELEEEWSNRIAQVLTSQSEYQNLKRNALATAYRFRGDVVAKMALEHYWEVIHARANEKAYSYSIYGI